MKLKKIDNILAIYKIKDIKSLDLDQDFLFIAKTDEEISVVCDKDYKIDNFTEESKYWRALRVDECLDFNLIGIIKNISTVLANNNIPIFAISTFNTDYILVKEENFNKTINVLLKNNYEII